MLVKLSESSMLLTKTKGPRSLGYLMTQKGTW